MNSICNDVLFGIDLEMVIMPCSLNGEREMEIWTSVTYCYIKYDGSVILSEKLKNM